MRRILASAAGASLALCLIGATNVAAATFAVSNTGDSATPGSGSLRAAIAAANANGSATAQNPHLITFSVSGTIDLATALPDIDNHVEIRGPGASQLTVRRDSGSLFRIFVVTAGRTAEISGLTVTNGRIGTSSTGAGIDNRGNLTLRNSVVTGNSAEATGASGGGIRNSQLGTLTLIGSTVSGNIAATDSGGIKNSDNPSGPGGGTVILRNSTVSGNEAGTGGGGVGGGDGNVTLEDSTVRANIGGGVSSSGTLVVRRSTISQNDAQSGGGIRLGSTGTATIEESTISQNVAATTATQPTAVGGGILNAGGSLTLLRSTVAGNRAEVRAVGAITPDASGGGIFVRDGGTTRVVASTISGNQADSFVGGILVWTEGHTFALAASTLVQNQGAPGGAGNLGVTSFGAATPTVVTVRSTLLAEPVGGSANCLVDSASSFSSTGFNFADDSSCGLGQSTDTQGVNPLIGPLASNGGPTQTHAPQSASPVLDRGTAATGIAGIATLTTDQRGEPRPSDFQDLPNAPGGDGSDIGAFELQAPPPAPPPSGNGGSISNQFEFGKLKRNSRKGTARLAVRVPGPGRVVLRRSKQLRKHVVRAEQKGRVRVMLRPRGKLKRKLARAVKDPRVTRVRARVRARVTYRPRGGEPRTKAKRVRLVRRAR